MKKIGKTLIGLFLMLMVIAIPLMFFSAVLIPYSDYLKNKGDLVPITANVSHIYEFEDSDDDTCYEIYLTYEYDGKLYENIYWEDTYKDNLKVGQVISVEISSVNPEYIRKTDIGGRQLVIDLIVTSGIFAAIIYSAGFYKLKKTDDIRTIDENAVLWELSPRAIFSFLNAVIGFGISLYGASFFTPELVTNTKIANYCFFGGIILLFAAVIRSQKSDVEGYSITTNKCIRKWTESDGDSTSEYVEFQNLPYNKSVGRKVYAHSEEGEFYYVLSSKNGEIREVYDTKKWVLKVDSDNWGQAGRKVIIKALSNAVTCAVIMFFIPLIFEIIARFLASR